MNGPVILNNARESLADEIFGYREPKPAPLKISPWLAMSLLQKAIRRGESAAEGGGGRGDLTPGWGVQPLRG